MHSLLQLALSLGTLTAGVLSIPDVTPVLLTDGCASFPDYDASTGIAGPWILQLNSCDNPDIEGFGDNSQLIRREGDTGIHEGRVNHPLVILARPSIDSEIGLNSERQPNRQEPSALQQRDLNPRRFIPHRSIRGSMAANEHLVLPVRR